MSRKEEGYSSYLTYESMLSQILAVFCGFTFTAITILLSLLPYPSSLQSQVALFFLAFLFNLFQFLLFFVLYYSFHCVKKSPPEIKGRPIIFSLVLLSFSLWNIAIVLMYFLWNLAYLALASGVVYVLFTILTFIFVWKPFVDLSKKIRSKNGN